MNHLLLVKNLAVELPQFVLFLSEVSQNWHYLKKYLNNCEKLAAYCGEVHKFKSSCSEIYHAELSNIFDAIRNIKLASANYLKIPFENSIKLFYDLEISLNADFYDYYVIIKGSKFRTAEVEDIELKNYVDKGRFLKDSELTLLLVEELKKLKIRGVSSYYSALIGPSYMGKTQTAFTLAHRMTVFYVNFVSFYYDTSSLIEQVIYRAMKPLSYLFHEVVKADISESAYYAAPNMGTEFFLNGEFDEKKWKTLGLIFALLKWKLLHSPEFDDPELWFKSFGAMESVIIQPFTLYEFISKVEGKNINI